MTSVITFFVFLPTPEPDFTLNEHGRKVYTRLIANTNVRTGKVKYENLFQEIRENIFGPNMPQFEIKWLTFSVSKVCSRK